MNRILILSAAVFIVFFFPSETSADYDKAMEAYLKEDYIQAAKRFDRFIGESPSDPMIRRAVYYSALCRIQLEQPRFAVERLQSLMTDSVDETPTLIPGPAAVRLALGTAHEQSGDETSALAMFESAWLLSANAFERGAAREKIREVRGRPVQSMVRADSRNRGVWVVQVESTPDQSKASSTRAVLASAGWPVYQEPAQIRGELFHRVRVGPYELESEAAAARGKIKSSLGLDGWVTKK